MKTHDYPKEAWGCNKPPAAVTASITGLTPQEQARADLARYVHFRERAVNSRSSADAMEKARVKVELAVGGLTNVRVCCTCGDRRVLGR